jgi:hypothetical protein
MNQVFALQELITHGQHVNPAYEGGAAGQSSPTDRPDAVVHGTLARFGKRQAASANAQAFGWVKATYPDAIEYAGQKQALEGGIMVGAFFGVSFAMAGIGMAIWILLEAKFWTAYPIGLVMLLISTPLAYWSLLFPLRHVWRTPRDLPIVFDRAHRKVYRMAQQRVPGLKGLIKPWPVVALAYDWDLVDAEHNSEFIGSANTGRRLHRLLFVVRKSADDPTIIDSFEIGNGLAQGEEMVAPMYEHIRRFLEERGPHLPHRDEPLDERSDDLPTWWQACGRAGPWGNRYLWWWKNDKFMSGLHHLLMLAGVVPAVIGLSYSLNWGPLIMLGMSWISLSMVWGQGTGIWLMAHTSYRLDWPAAVHDAIGAATRKGTGW